jgi:hypothetical protein
MSHTTTINNMSLVVPVSGAIITYIEDEKLWITVRTESQHASVLELQDVIDQLQSELNKFWTAT